MGGQGRDGNRQYTLRHVESTSSCLSEHSLEHALSAYHPDLPHGAGLIMISQAYYTHFAQAHACDSRLIDMARALGKKDATHPMDFVIALVQLQVACGVDNLKMSDYWHQTRGLARHGEKCPRHHGRPVPAGPDRPLGRRLHRHIRTVLPLEYFCRKIRIGLPRIFPVVTVLSHYRLKYLIPCHREFLPLPVSCKIDDRQISVG